MSGRLTTAEATALCLQWQRYGDRQARERLILAYQRIVTSIVAHKIGLLPRRYEIDDLTSAGNVALVAATDSFDPNRGSSFAQYAWLRVNGAILDEVRRLDWAPRRWRAQGRVTQQMVSTSAVCGTATPFTIGEMIPAAGPWPEDATLAQERAAMLRGALTSLPERERFAVAAMHVHHLSGHETGALLGVTNSRVSQLLRQAKDRIRDAEDHYEGRAA